MTLVSPVSDPTADPAAPVPAAAPASSPAPSAQAPETGPSGAPQAEAGTGAPAEVDYKARYESVEKERIAPLMSERDTARNDLAKLREDFAGVDDEWFGWLEYGAERGFTAKQLLDAVRDEQRKAQGAETAAAASRSGTITLINGLYRKGETGFANYLQELLEAEPSFRLSEQSLARHRSTFGRLGGTGQAAAAGTSGTTTPAPGAAPASGGPRTAPVVPGTAGAPPPGGEPAWKPGTRSRTLLDKALGALGR